jgi:hypothetical protein
VKTERRCGVLKSGQATLALRFKVMLCQRPHDVTALPRVRSRVLIGRRGPLEADGMGLHLDFDWQLDDFYLCLRFN